MVTMCNFVADLPLPDSLWPALFVHFAGGSKARRSASPQWLQRWWRCAAPHNSLTHLDLPSLFIPQVGQRRGARFPPSCCGDGSSVLPAHHRGALLVRLPDPRSRLGHAAVVCGADEHVCCAGGCGRGGGVCSGLYAVDLAHSRSSCGGVGHTAVVRGPYEHVSCAADGRVVATFAQVGVQAVGVVSGDTTTP